jgi:hypothetical protein
MSDLIDMLDLRKLFSKAGVRGAKTFESAYSRLYARNPHSLMVQEIEDRVEDFFNRLTLPDTVTVYDILLLSLREKDAIFTFNWDPFLWDACERNYGVVPLPPTFYLHGNVRVGFCQDCRGLIRKAKTCPACGKAQTKTRLLFPIEQKNYADDPFIKAHWEAIRIILPNAFLLTVFGYSAPKTDREAVAILKDSWRGLEHKGLVDRVEIVDVRDRDELYKLWREFPFYNHIDIRSSIYDTYLGKYPRRSCEALYCNGVDGKFCERISIGGSLEDYQRVARELAEFEGDFAASRRD